MTISVEDLSARFRRGDLDDAELATLELALESSREAKLLHEAGLAFDAEPTRLPGDDDLIARIVASTIAQVTEPVVTETRAIPRAEPASGSDFSREPHGDPVEQLKLPDAPESVVPRSGAPRSVVARRSLRFRVAVTAAILGATGSAAAGLEWSGAVDWTAVGGDLASRMSALVGAGSERSARSPAEERASRPPAPAASPEASSAVPPSQSPSDGGDPPLEPSVEAPAEAPPAPARAVEAPRASAPAPDVLYARANALRRSGATAAAIREYEALRRAYPSSQEALTAQATLGQLYLSHGSSGAAIGAFERYLKAAPAGPLAPEALWGIAEAAARSGDARRLVTATTRLEQSYPGSAYAARARALLDKQQKAP